VSAGNADGCPPGKKGTQQTASASSDFTGGADILPIEALRCWSWRRKHRCWCPSAEDCLLTQPLPVHADSGGRGQFDGQGRLVADPFLPDLAPTGTGW
jgi:hypothetical protein